MASELERLFIRELDVKEAEPYAYGVFSTHYKLPMSGQSFEFHERHHGVARVTLDDHCFEFETAEGAAYAARQLRVVLLLNDFVSVEAPF